MDFSDSSPLTSMHMNALDKEKKQKKDKKKQQKEKIKNLKFTPSPNQSEMTKSEPSASSVPESPRKYTLISYDPDKPKVEASKLESPRNDSKSDSKNETPRSPRSPRSLKKSKEEKKSKKLNSKDDLSLSSEDFKSPRKDPLVPIIKEDDRGKDKISRLSPSRSLNKMVRRTLSVSPRGSKTPRKDGNEINEEFPIDSMWLAALKNVIGTGNTDEEKTAYTIQYLKEMFGRPSQSVVKYEIENIIKPNKRYIRKESTHYLIMNALKMETVKSYDCWSSLQLPLEVWSLKNELYNIDPDCTVKCEYLVETDSKSCSRDTDLNLYEIVNIDDDFTFYKQFLYKQPGAKYYLYPEQSAILCSLKQSKIYHVIAFKPNGLVRFILDKDEDIPKWWSKYYRSEEKPIKIKNNNNLKIQDNLLKLESQLIVKNYKFGVLYAKEGQQTEDEMYSNVECSPAFWKFMNLIGTRQNQFEWHRYIGGLDSQKHTTGEEFYYHLYEKFSYEIVYHVAPLLPDTEGEQKLERKRHLGNDIILIVFKEMKDENDTFNPKVISSHFNHIFIVVTPEITTEDNERYHVNIVCKGGIVPFPPFIDNPLFKHDEKFKDFMLRKLLNGERTALNCGIFQTNAIKSNTKLISHFITSSLD